MELMQGGISRRTFLGGMLAGGLMTLSHPALASFPSSRPRALSLENLHTGEKIKNVAYWEYGRYQPDAMAAINHILRDFRTDDVKAMDPQLLDLLHLVHRQVGSNRPFQVISGYRSAHTNAMLNKNSGGVAKKSMHMEGKAIDVRLADRSIADIRKAGLRVQRGGVGYYAESDFVHLDTGRVRSW